MKGLGKNTRYKKTAPLSKSYRKGGSTEVGKESQSYKEYVTTMFGGGATKYKDGGMVNKNKTTKNNYRGQYGIQVKKVKFKGIY